MLSIKQFSGLSQITNLGSHDSLWGGYFGTIYSVLHTSFTDEAKPSAQGGRISRWSRQAVDGGGFARRRAARGSLPGLAHWTSHPAFPGLGLLLCYNSGISPKDATLFPKTIP